MNARLLGDRRLTYDEARFYRDLGLVVTQVTFDATSLHATEVYRVSLPNPSPTVRVIDAAWDDIFCPPEDTLA